jgi:hypothetical protein
MKVELSVFERLQLLQVLPHEGHSLQLKSIRTARELVAFDTDAAECGIQTDARGNIVNEAAVHWQQEKAFELPTLAVAEAVSVLDKLEKEGKLPDRWLSLHEKLVEPLAGATEEKTE